MVSQPWVQVSVTQALPGLPVASGWPSMGTSDWGWFPPPGRTPCYHRPESRPHGSSSAADRPHDALEIPCSQGIPPACLLVAEGGTASPGPEVKRPGCSVTSWGS